MKRYIIVELFEEHEQTNIYTIRFQDKEESEVDEFISLFDNDEYKDDFDIIYAVIDKLGENGVLERYFRPEGGNLKAIPLTTSNLRLYCYRISDEILILGNGGLKTTKTYNEDPVLNKHVTTLRLVGNMLMNSIAQGKTTIDNKTLYDNLKFFLKEKEE